MAKVKVWKKPDGSVATTYFNYNLKRDDETDEAFIERLTVNSEYAGMDSVILDDSELPSDGVKKLDRNKWRLKANNKLEVDSTIETEDEKRTKLEKKAKAELKKSGLPDDVVEFLSKGKR